MSNNHLGRLNGFMGNKISIKSHEIICTILQIAKLVYALEICGTRDNLFS